jgi:hypothetical protein
LNSAPCWRILRQKSPQHSATLPNIPPAIAAVPPINETYEIENKNKETIVSN